MYLLINYFIKMVVKLTLPQLQELNSIKGMLESADKETNRLGLTLFINDSVIKDYFYDASFEVRPGKNIPVHWFVRKSQEIIKEEKDDYWQRLILPIVDAIIQGEPKFQVPLYFRYDIIDERGKALDTSNFQTEPF